MAKAAQATKILNRPRHGNLRATTTLQEDITTAGQRKVNLIWEFTQAFVAIIVVMSNMVVGVLFAVRGTSAGDFPVVLSSSLFLVIGFYFSRTNHSAIGGIGSKPLQKYVGR